MKTKSKSFKRKFPYDSDFDCQPIGISKKQNLGPIDAFGHAIIINGDNHTLKPPLATYCLHEEPSAVRDLDTCKPAHSHINIDSEPVVLPILILRMLFVLFCHSLHVCLCIAAVTFSSVGIAQSNKQKEICPDGSDQFPVNKGDVMFALDNIQAPSARVTNPEHDHVVHEHSIVATVQVLALLDLKRPPIITWYGVLRDSVVASEVVVRFHGYGGEIKPI
ncbi:hypothetical protein Tco_1111745, partial [Tanacetum coccineum]